MKKILFAVLIISAAFGVATPAYAITCGVGEIVSPGPLLTPAVPAVLASVTPGYFTGPWWNLVWHPPVFHPAIPAVPATYGLDTCIPDPGYVPPVVPPVVIPPTITPEAPKPIIGGTQPWCSSPTAPGWTVGLPNGGCGSNGFFGSVAATFFGAGETITKNGVSYVCPFWFFSGCIVK